MVCEGSAETGGKGVLAAFTNTAALLLTSLITPFFNSSTKQLGVMSLKETFPPSSYVCVCIYVCMYVNMFTGWVTGFT